MSGEIADLDGDEATMIDTIGTQEETTPGEYVLPERFRRLKPYDELLPPGQSVDEQVAAHARAEAQRALERKQQEEKERLETITVKELRDWLMLLPDRCSDMPIVILDGPPEDNESDPLKGVSIVDDRMVLDILPVVVTEEIRYGKFGPVKD